MSDVRTTTTPDPNHPITQKADHAAAAVNRPKRSATASKGYSKSITEQDGLWHVFFYVAPKRDGEVEDQISLGNFPTRHEAERACEDAIARHIYNAEMQAADDEVRAAYKQAEEDRVKDAHDRQAAARDVSERKEPAPRRATAAQTKAAKEADEKAAADQK